MVVAAASLGSAIGTPTAAAQSPARAAAEAMRQRAAERLRALQKEADDLAAQAQSLVGELRRFEVERDLRTEQLRQAERDLAAATGDVEAADRKVADFAAHLAAARPRLEARLVELYKLGRPGYARLVLAVDDPRQIGRAVRLSETMARSDRQRVEEYQRSLDELARARLELSRRVARAEVLRNDRRLAREAAARAVTARAAMVRNIDASRDLAAQLVAELQQADERLRRAIGAMTLNPGTVSPVDPTVLPFLAFRGDLPWPVSGDVTSGFGTHRDPRFGTSIIHNGIEIEAAEGTPVAAVHGGRVAFADVFTGYGQLVIVDHGGQAFSLYGYLGDLAVKAGAPLSAGAQIGSVGRAPSGAAAVYFEVRIDGKAVDPVEWLKPRS